MRYRYVLLDAGATILGPREPFGVVYARILSELGVTAEPALYEASLYGALSRMESDIPAGTDRFSHFDGGEEEYWRRFASLALAGATGRDVDDALAEKAVEGLRDVFRDGRAWRVFPDVPPALDALRRDGARLAVVSNWDSLLPGLLDQLDLTRYFDAVVVSGLEGVEKPDPGLFRIALERIDGAAESALHVGDRPDMDLAGARAADVDAVLVDRDGRLDDRWDALPDLSRLPELARRGLTR